VIAKILNYISKILCKKKSNLIILNHRKEVMENGRQEEQLWLRMYWEKAG
jgi:hypothetical protein